MKDSTFLSSPYRDLAIGLLSLVIGLLICATVGVPLAL